MQLRGEALASSLELAGLSSGVGGGRRREGAENMLRADPPEIWAGLAVTESKKPLSILKLCAVICCFKA